MLSELHSGVVCDEALGVGAKHDNKRNATYKVSFRSGQGFCVAREESRAMKRI